MKPKLIAIAGGTGVGKSTICFALADKYPNKISIVHLDDYHTKTSAPIHQGFLNWDHPNALNFKQLRIDLTNLLAGKTITVQTKNERFNRNAKEVGRLPMDVKAMPIILLEGYLSLWDAQVRELLSESVYLDLDYLTRIQRRTKFMDESYQNQVLIPMHKKYVEPTKQFAKHIINVTGQSITEVVHLIEEIILPLLIDQ